MNLGETVDVKLFVTLSTDDDDFIVPDRDIISGLIADRLFPEPLVHEGNHIHVISVSVVEIGVDLE